MSSVEKLSQSHYFFAAVIAYFKVNYALATVLYFFKRQVNFLFHETQMQKWSFRMTSEFQDQYNYEGRFGYIQKHSDYIIAVSQLKRSMANPSVFIGTSPTKWQQPANNSSYVAKHIRPNPLYRRTSM